MADVDDRKSALLYALKFEAANEASCRDRYSIHGARVTADAPYESPGMKEMKKLKEEIHKTMAQLQKRRRRSITYWGCGEPRHLRSNCPRNNKEDCSTKCWGCGGMGHLRNNCLRVNHKYPHRASEIESKNGCSVRKGSSDENGVFHSKRPWSENSKNLSNSLRVEKKFGAIGPVVHQVKTPSTSSLDPWSDESVRIDQLADSEIKPIIEFKESSDEKPIWEDIALFHPTTKRYWAL
ncbi:uncharacterized protein TNCV_2770961 [Trichonephila clavipes]|nr:uncharacterized protein TNCV_2770961 [Trichonephila clavipes]